ncbi:NYN domain-containing protein [Clostridium polynesiense]|uniref:NYN domain-containing protein n=1 Tax=Clostridium polynesiense TaxID=1325933 RepID=UPI00058B5E12|nr:NYN domain-containing protein [Clostridium polynesiense]
MRIIFVDGYNVINSWPELKEIKEYSYEGARKKLIDSLQNYSSYKDCRVFLVFDAHKVPGALEKKDRMGNLIIVFTKDGETADSYIERCVNDIGRKTEVFVVTSDSLEQQLVFQRGAVRMSSIEFYHEILSIEKNIRKKSDKLKEKIKDRLEDRIEKDVRDKLEKIRRSR